MVQSQEMEERMNNERIAVASPDMTAAARAVTEHLASGLPLDTASLETILQALGETNPVRAFGLLAADAEASEHAPLLALAFSPGLRTRRELEPALAKANLDAAGAAELARLAAQGIGKEIPAALLLPDGSRLPLAPRRSDIMDFVRRLRPEATAPAELRRILERRFSGKREALDLAVLLRHSRLDWTPGRVFFLAALVERAHGQDDLAALTAWALGFLDLAGPEFEPRAALQERRQALVNQLRLAEAQEEAVERASFEVRLSQGQRHGYVHGPDLRAGLALLDRTCKLVLGLQGEDLGSVNVRDLGQAMDAEELLRILPV